jgi:uncharacterized protein YbjT (DUF2867 family)
MERKMKIVVIGASGFIGTRLVGRLRHGAHDVVAASPASGVNTISGDGLPEAMEGAAVVIDVSNSPTYDDAPARDFFVTSGSNLMAAERAAHVAHHIVLSIVGTDRLQGSGYFRGKLIQEQIVRESGQPHTIVRSTQFFEFLERVAGYSMANQVVRLSPALVQPVAVDDVVEILAQFALLRPMNGVVELAGPHSFRLNKAVARVLESKFDDRLVVADPDAPYFGVILNEATLVPDGTAIIAPTSFEDWLRRMMPPLPVPVLNQVTS